MDMITAIELQDALANFEKVTARVLEVAMFIGSVNKEITGDREWRLVTFMQHSLRRRGSEVEEEPAITAFLTTSWHNRPVTEKYGDPRDDEEDIYDTRGQIERRITYPSRYLWTDGWQADVEKRRRDHELWMANYQAEQLEEAIKKTYSQADEQEKKLKALRQRAAELEEKPNG